MTKELKGKTTTYSFNPDDKSTIVGNRARFSTAYLGSDPSTGENVLIKQFNVSLGTTQDLEQFVHEALVDFDHPNIGKTLDLIRTDRGIFLVKPFYNGVDLKTALSKRKYRKLLKPEVVANIGIKLCGALELLHERGIIHRDIKPSNILLKTPIDSGEPEPVLIDFGLAKHADKPSTEGKKTPFSMIYSPPEQVLNRDGLVDGRSDIYALGMTLYEAAARKAPYESTHPIELMNLQISHPLPRSRRIPKEFFAVLEKATAKYPFPKPPNQYSRKEMDRMLVEGMEKRFDMIAELRSHLVQAVTS